MNFEHILVPVQYQYVHCDCDYLIAGDNNIVLRALWNVHSIVCSSTKFPHTTSFNPKICGWQELYGGGIRLHESPLPVHPNYSGIARVPENEKATPPYANGTKMIALDPNNDFD